MKKIWLRVCIILWGLFLFQPSIQAQQNFSFQVELPASTEATFTVSRVFPGSPEVFFPINTDILDFGVISFNADNGIFLPEYYYAIDVSGNNAGQPNLQFTYTDTANPNGGLNDGSGLGGRGTIAFGEVITDDQFFQSINVIRGESLQQVNLSGGIDGSDYANGFLRIFIGIATGDPALQEGDAVPFTQLDQPGMYSGTLTVTTTFD